MYQYQDLTDYTPGIRSLQSERYIVFIFPFVEVTTKFCIKVSQMGISRQPLIRKRSYLVMGAFECPLTFHKLWPQGSFPRVGLEVRIWDTLRSVKLLFLFCLPLIEHKVTGNSHAYDPNYCVMRWMSGWLYFIVEWFAQYLEGYLMWYLG